MCYLKNEPLKWERKNMVSKQCMFTQELEHVFCLFGWCVNACMCVHVYVFTCLLFFRIVYLVVLRQGLLLNLGLMGSIMLLASLSQVPPTLELRVYTTNSGLLFYLIISLWWYFLNICLHFENFTCFIFFYLHYFHLTFSPFQLPLCSMLPFPLKLDWANSPEPVLFLDREYNF